jgi:hypothetical protein
MPTPDKSAFRKLAFADSQFPEIPFIGRYLAAKCGGYTFVME